MFTKNELTIVLPSNTRSFTSHMNSNTNFEVKLHTPLDVSNGDYYLGLSEISLPPINITLKYILTHMKRAKKRIKTTPRWDILEVKQIYEEDPSIFIERSARPQGAYIESDELVTDLKKDTGNQSLFMNRKFLTDSKGLARFELPLIIGDDPSLASGYFYESFNMANLDTRKHSQDVVTLIRSAMTNYSTAPHATNPRHGARFKPVTTSTLLTNDSSNPYVKIQNLMVYLPDYQDSVTRGVMEHFGYPTVESLKTSKDYVFFEVDEEKVPFDFNIHIESNIVDYSRTGRGERQLLRSIKRKTPFEFEHVELSNVNFLPLLNIKQLETINIRLLQDNGKPAHIYDKCQVVALLKRKV